MQHNIWFWQRIHSFLHSHASNDMRSCMATTHSLSTNLPVATNSYNVHASQHHPNSGWTWALWGAQRRWLPIANVHCLITQQVSQIWINLSALRRAAPVTPYCQHTHLDTMPHIQNLDEPERSQARSAGDYHLHSHHEPCQTIGHLILNISGPLASKTCHCVVSVNRHEFSKDILWFCVLKKPVFSFLFLKAK